MMSAIMLNSSFDVDNKINSLKKYFDVKESFEDLIEMTSKERIVWFEKLINNQELSLSELDTLLKKLDEEFETFESQARVEYKSLKKMLKSESEYLSSYESVKLEMGIMDLEEIIQGLESDVSDDFETALNEYKKKNIDISDGSHHQFNENDAKDGDHFIIDAQTNNSGRADLNRRSPFDPHPDFVDIDFDGYGDVDPCLDQNNRPTVDANGDGEISEKDTANYQNKTEMAQTIKLNLQENTILTLESYDLSSGELVFSCFKKDGAMYKITILGFIQDCKKNIVLTGANGGLISTEQFESWPETVTKNFFESQDTQNTGMSFYHVLNGQRSSVNEGEYFTLINMGDHGNSLTLPQPAFEDFRQHREYTIDFEHNTIDNLVLNLPDGKITATQKNGYPVLNVMAHQGKISIVLVGLESTDFVTINGGEFDWSNPSTYNSLSTCRVLSGSIFSIIEHNGVLLAEQVAARGIVPANSAINLCSLDFDNEASLSFGFIEGCDQQLNIEGLLQDDVIDFESDSEQNLVLVITRGDKTIRITVLGMFANEEFFDHSIYLSGGVLSEGLKDCFLNDNDLFKEIIGENNIYNLYKIFMPNNESSSEHTSVLMLLAEHVTAAADETPPEDEFTWVPDDEEA